MSPLLGHHRPHRDRPDHLRLTDPVAVGDEDESGLEQPDPWLLPIHVVDRRSDQAGPQGRTHDAHVRRDRIGEHDPIEGRGDARLQRGVHEAVGHRLVVSALDEPPADARHVDVALRPRGDAQTGGRGRLRQVLEAGDSRDLLDEILLDADVRTVRRGGHDPAGLRLLYPHPEPDEDVMHLMGRDLGAEHAPDAGAAKGDGLGARAVPAVGGFDDRARLATGDVDEQLRRPLHRLALQIRCDGAFEAV